MSSTLSCGISWTRRQPDRSRFRFASVIFAASTLSGFPIIFSFASLGMWFAFWLSVITADILRSEADADELA